MEFIGNENGVDLSIRRSGKSWRSSCRRHFDDCSLVFLVMNRQVRLQVVHIGAQEAANVANKLEICVGNHRGRGRYDQR